MSGNSELKEIRLIDSVFVPFYKKVDLNPLFPKSMPEFYIYIMNYSLIEIITNLITNFKTINLTHAPHKSDKIL